MNKREVIEYIANNHLVEDIVHNIAGNTDDDLNDLIQDIYLDFFDKSDKILNNLYQNNQLNFYITRIVMNNVFSTTSRYYTTYKKGIKNKVHLDDIDYDKY